MGRTACTEPQCLYKGDLYLYYRNNQTVCFYDTLWLRIPRYKESTRLVASLYEEGFSAPVQTGPGAHPASCTMGTGCFPGVKSGQGVRLTPHPFYCRDQERVELYLYLPLWAVRPVQSLSACTRVTFTFFTFVQRLIDFHISVILNTKKPYPMHFFPQSYRAASWYFQNFLFTNWYKIF
jgi:hypothetical protein